MKKLLIILLGGAMLATRVWGVGAPIVSVAENKDYTLITNVSAATVKTDSKVDVKEFFSYSCIHCKLIESLVVEKLSNNKKIILDKIQVLWGDNTDLLGFAKLSATIQLLAQDKSYQTLMNKINSAAFNAIINHQNISDVSRLRAFLLKNGMTNSQADIFIETYNNSFSVSTKVNEYRSLTMKYNITQTPTFIVADKYMVNPATPERSMQVIQALVEKCSKK